MNAQVTPADYLESIRLDSRPRPLFLALGLGLVVLGGLIAFDMVFDVLPKRKQAEADQWFPVVYVLSLVFLSGWYWIYIPYRVNTVFRQQKSLHEPFDVEVVDDGLKFESALGSGVLPWSHIDRWRESMNLIIIEHSDSLRNLIPKRDFAGPEEIGALRARLQENVGPADQPRPTSS